MARALITLDDLLRLGMPDIDGARALLQMIETRLGDVQRDVHELRHDMAKMRDEQALGIRDNRERIDVVDRRVAAWENQARGVAKTAGLFGLGATTIAAAAWAGGTRVLRFLVGADH